MAKICENDFLQPIDWGDCAAVKTFINQPNELPYDHEYIVNKLSENTWSLNDVATLGKLELTKLFLDNNDSIDIDDVYEDNDWTVLHYAICRKDIDLAKLLLDRDADPNVMDSDSHTPLYYLYSDTFDDKHSDVRLKILKMLIDRGAKLSTIWHRFTSLQIEPVLKYGDEKAVEYVLTLDIDLRALYGEGDDTVVHFLARNRHPKTLTKIRGRNFYVDALNCYAETPLWQASYHGVVDAIEFLLSEGANINAADVENYTPLYAAIQAYKDDSERFKNVVQILIERGADIQIVSRIEYAKDKTIFYVLGKHGNAAMHELIIEYLALQEAEGVKIIKPIQIEIDSKDKLKKYFDTCKDFLSEKVFDSKTLLDFRGCSEEKLGCYMRNADFVRVINDYCGELKLKTHSYGNWLQKRIDKASKAAALKDSAAAVICKLMKIEYNCYSFIVDTILRYLRDEDLNTLLSISF